jgi:PAS domain S-box-containing protein
LTAAPETPLGGPNDLFRLLVENVSDYAILFACNVGVEPVLGWAEADLTGQSIEVIFTPEDRKSGVPDQEMDQARREGWADNERWHTRGDGGRFWASGTMNALRDATGGLRGFAKIVRDRTERK